MISSAEVTISPQNNLLLKAISLQLKKKKKTGA